MAGRRSFPFGAKGLFSGAKLLLVSGSINFIPTFLKWFFGPPQGGRVSTFLKTTYLREGKKFTFEMWAKPHQDHSGTHLDTWTSIKPPPPPHTKFPDSFYSPRKQASWQPVWSARWHIDEQWVASKICQGRVVTSVWMPSYPNVPFFMPFPNQTIQFYRGFAMNVTTWVFFFSLTFWGGEIDGNPM